MCPSDYFIICKSIPLEIVQKCFASKKLAKMGFNQGKKYLRMRISKSKRYLKEKMKFDSIKDSGIRELLKDRKKNDLKFQIDEMKKSFKLKLENIKNLKLQKKGNLTNIIIQRINRDIKFELNDIKKLNYKMEILNQKIGNYKPETKLSLIKLIETEKLEENENEKKPAKILKKKEKIPAHSVYEKIIKKKDKIDKLITANFKKYIIKNKIKQKKIKFKKISLKKTNLNISNNQIKEAITNSINQKQEQEKFINQKSRNSFSNINNKVLNINITTGITNKTTLLQPKKVNNLGNKRFFSVLANYTEADYNNDVVKTFTLLLQRNPNTKSAKVNTISPARKNAIIYTFFLFRFWIPKRDDIYFLDDPAVAKTIDYINPKIHLKNINLLEDINLEISEQKDFYLIFIIYFFFIGLILNSISNLTENITDIYYAGISDLASRSSNLIKGFFKKR